MNCGIENRLTFQLVARGVSVKSDCGCWGGLVAVFLTVESEVKRFIADPVERFLKFVASAGIILARAMSY